MQSRCILLAGRRICISSPWQRSLALALGHKSPSTVGVKKIWSELTNGRTEIEVLVEADLMDLKSEPKVIEAIEAFRSGKVEVCPGGGGRYGQVRLPNAAPVGPGEGRTEVAVRLWQGQSISCN